MIRHLQRAYFRIQIKAMLALTPAMLFKKINLLDWYQSTLRNWAKEFQSDSHLKILEVGCATGALSEYLAESGCSVSGVDASATMIDIAKSGNHLADYHVADVNCLPFEANMFDAVISSSLINIVPDKNKAIAEMVRVCKHNGRISFLVPTQGFSNKQLKNLVDSMGLSGFSEIAIETWHNAAPKMEKENIEAMLREAGLLPAPARDYLNGMVFSMTATKA